MLSSVKKTFNCLVAIIGVGLLGGCQAASRHMPDVTFNWGPDNLPISSSPSPMAKPLFSQEDNSPAARLRREEIQRYFSDTPNDREWRQLETSGRSPTIVGFGLRYDLSNQDWSLKVGAIKRGSKSKMLTRLSLSFDDL